jgi:protein-tyrosine-phosphatase
MAERGLDLSGHQSKGVADLPPRHWDYVVTMGCGDACPAVPARRRIDWPIPDPAAGSPEDVRRIRDRIEALVREILLTTRT